MEKIIYETKSEQYVEVPTGRDSVKAMDRIPEWRTGFKERYRAPFIL